MVSKGDKIKVVRGVKVPRGTTGVAFWVGETKYGLRVGFKNDANGETLWTAMGNVERVEEYSPAVAGAVAATSASAAFGALMARLSELEARVEMLEANAPALAPFIPDNADPVEIAAFTN